MSDIAASIQYRASVAPERAKEHMIELLDKTDTAMNNILMAKTNQTLTTSSNELATITRYHTRLAIMNIDPDVPPMTKLDVACEIVSLLRHSKMPATALHHHFKFLATVVLFELSKVRETSETARLCLEDFQNALSVSELDPGFWDQHIRSIVANRLNQIQTQTQSGNSTDKQGLQHLADAAIKEGQGGEQGNSDVAEAIRKAEAAATAMEGPEDPNTKGGGYLSALL